MKESLFSKDSEYNKFEFLTGYENLKFNNMEFWNAMDYIVIDEPIKIDINIPNFIKLPGYKLNLYDSSSNISSEINIISKIIPDDYLNSLASCIELNRLNAIEAKQQGRRWEASKAWKEYYKTIGSFTTPNDLYYEGRLIRKKSFDYGYAVTIHKSQGSSINNVFIDMKSISACREKEEVRQLQYVALSRAMTNAFIYQ